MPRLKGSADLLEDRRRRALALCDKGLSLNEVGRRIQCAASSVLRWLRARRRGGPDALRAHTARLPIPERLWAAAVELAREHGVSRTAQALRLEYGKLRRLMESASPVVKSRMVKAPAARRSRPIAPPAFVELMPSPTAGLSECVIELQGRRGKMRIHWKGTTAPDLGGLSRTLWKSK